MTSGIWDVRHYGLRHLTTEYGKDDMLLAVRACIRYTSFLLWMWQKFIILGFANLKGTNTLAYRAYLKVTKKMKWCKYVPNFSHCGIEAFKQRGFVASFASIFESFGDTCTLLSAYI